MRHYLRDEVKRILFILSFDSNEMRNDPVMALHIM